jgi:PAS domain-containing protein
MAEMNIQQRTAKTLSPPGPSAAPEVARVPRQEWPPARDGLAVTYEHVGVGIVEVDQAGRMLRVNQKACELMGHEAADLLGRSIFDETAPQDVGQDLAQYRRHNVSFIKDLCTRAVFMSNGRILQAGTVDELLASKVLTDLYFGV